MNRYTLSKAISTGTLALSLAVVSAVSVSAQTGTGRDDGFDYGWLGLAGLAGLIGLLRKRDTHDTHRNNR